MFAPFLPSAWPQCKIGYTVGQRTISWRGGWWFIRGKLSLSRAGCEFDFRLGHTKHCQRGSHCFPACHSFTVFWGIRSTNDSRHSIAPAHWVTCREQISHPLGCDSCSNMVQGAEISQTTTTFCFIVVFCSAEASTYLGRTLHRRGQSLRLQGSGWSESKRLASHLWRRAAAWLTHKAAVFRVLLKIHKPNGTFLPQGSKHTQKKLTDKYNKKKQLQNHTRRKTT